MSISQRESGIDVIGEVPWSTHFCQFYETKADLIDILIPYFKAGLENNEFCIWVTSEPLGVEDAKEALGKVLPDVDNYLANGQLEIIPYTEWHSMDGVFCSERMLNGWMDKLNTAKDKGYDGLRLTRNTFWLEKKDWNDFVEYEEEINKTIGNFDMIAMCTYSLDKCNANEIIDVVNNHEFALIKREDEWTLVESAKQRKTYEALRESEVQFRSLYETNFDATLITIPDGSILSANPAAQKMFGMSEEEIINAGREGLLVKDENLKQALKKREQNGYIKTKLKFKRKDNSLFTGELTSNIFMDADGAYKTSMIIRDVTKTIKTEQKLQTTLKRFYTILSNMRESVLLVTEDGLIEFANKAFCDYFNLSESSGDLLGLTDSEVIGKIKNVYRYPKKAVTRIQDIVDDWQAVYGEEVPMVKDKTCLRDFIPLYTDVKPYGRLWVHYDITERKKTEEAVNQSRKLLYDIINGFPSAIFVKDVEGRFLIVNNKLEEQLGIKNEELKGKTDYDIITKELAEYYRANDKKVLKEGKPISFEEEADLIDGHHTFIANKFPIYDIKGESYGVGSISTDITKRKKLEEELRDNEEKYRSLYSSMSEGVALHDIVYNSDNEPVDYVIIDVNPRFEKITGLKSDEIINRKASDVYGTDNPPYIEIYAPVAAGGEPTEFETYFEPMDKHFRISVVSPKLDKFATIFEDITERKKAEEYKQKLLEKEQQLTEELQTSNEELQSTTEELLTTNSKLQIQSDLMDLSLDAIIMGNRDGGIELWNNGAKKLYGYSKSETIGQPIYELLFTEFPRPWPEIEAELRTGGVWEGELKHRTKNLRKIIVSSRIQLIKGNDGQEKYLESNRDITSRKKAEEQVNELLNSEQRLTEELRVSNEELQSTTEELQVSNEELQNQQDELRKLIDKLEVSNRELEQFAYVASHDLQEPLRMVSSFTQLLEHRYKDQLDEDADDYIGFIVEGAYRMKDLIDDLLAFSRLNTETKPFEVFNMETALNSVLSYLKSSIEEHDVKITHDSLPSINGDSSQIQQLFQNLISNAIKFRGDESPCIHISAEKTGYGWLFGVRDNGIGIDTEHQEKIFEVFRRLHTRDEYEGTGIGLSICKKIVERHGGRIWVESKEGEGSTFYFTMPQ